MVLSNKKLKQKLRADKAEQILQNQDSSTKLSNPQDRNPGLSKREKRRQKVEQEKPVGVDGEGDQQTESKINGEKIRQKKKRKRDQSEEGSVNVKEKSQLKVNKRKKKTKNNKKPKKAVEEKKVEEGNERSEQILVKPDESIDGKDLEASNKVYVGGIPYYSTEDDIRSYFESCGTMTSIDCMTFPDSGKFRGIAIIAFKTEAAATRALALDGSDMGGLFLKIQPFKSSAKASKSPNFNPTVKEGYNRIYAGNLSWEITEDDLRKLFCDCNISSIRFGEDKQTGEFKGYAHVDFSDSLSMSIAMKLDQAVVCGRPVRITCAVPKKATSDKSKMADNVAETSKPRITSAPVEDKADHSTAKPIPDDKMNSDVIIKVDENQFNTGGADASSSKIKRRTCYECGERGHISSLCPKKSATDTIKPEGSEVQISNLRLSLIEDQGDIINGDMHNGDIVDEEHRVNNSGVAASNSKIRRRTCYECGERGHLSSLCPKNRAADKLKPVSKDGEAQASKSPSSSFVEDGGDYSSVKSMPKDNNKMNSKGDITMGDEKNQVNISEAAAVVSSSKIRRRTCYECGERGHISSLCPKKQAAAAS